jgi:hypothetical protein
MGIAVAENTKPAADIPCALLLDNIVLSLGRWLRLPTMDPDAA